MKTTNLLQPTVWIASAFLVTTHFVAHGEDANKKRSNDAQAILDSLNSERNVMVTSDGTPDPQEIEHVQRMVRLYELKAGFADVESARKELGLASPEQSTVAAQDSSARENDVEQLRTEVVDLRQQLDELKFGSQAEQKNGAVQNEAAGAERPASSEDRYFRDRPKIP